MRCPAVAQVYLDCVSVPAGAGPPATAVLWDIDGTLLSSGGVALSVKSSETKGVEFIRIGLVGVG